MNQLFVMHFQLDSRNFLAPRRYNYNECLDDTQIMSVVCRSLGSCTLNGCARLDNLGVSVIGMEKFSVVALASKGFGICLLSFKPTTFSPSRA